MESATAAFALPGSARPSGSSPTTLPEWTAERLSTVIAGMASNERLGSKEEVRRWCGVSAGSFNEALRLLQARGMVTVRRGPNGGIFAAAPSPMKRLGLSIYSEDALEPTLPDAFRIRGALDALLVEDALEHCQDADIRALRAQVAEMYTAADAGNGRAFTEANLSFHERLCLVSPNVMLRPIYIGLIDYIRSQSRDYPELSEAAIDRMRSRAGAHDSLVDAIEARDPRMARLMLERHNAEVWVTTGASPAAASPDPA